MRESKKSTESTESARSTEPATDGYIVGYSAAEQLARSFDSFTPVQIRETLEFESFTEAMRLLTRFSKKQYPYQELKHHAMVNELGYYKGRKERPSAQEEYERYLSYLEIKDSVHWAKKGTRLTASQRDDLTRTFYAPVYRAEMAKLSAKSWDSRHGYQNDHGGASHQDEAGEPSDTHQAAPDTRDKREVA